METKMAHFTRLCCITLMLGSPLLQASGLKADEEILYFPTNGNWSEENGAWQLALHGWIFELEHDSLWRQGTMAALRQHLGLAPQDNGSHHLKARGRLFLVDNERGKRITVSIAGKTFDLAPSQANGHLFGEAWLDGETGNSDEPTQWLHFETVTPAEDKRRFEGEIQLIAARGLSIISDIDDTIKLSNVLDKEELLENTFLRDFQAIPGMADHYRQWAAQGAAFHYVTSSPWQLYPSLKTFLDTEDFPPGSFSMRHFRIKDSSLPDFLSSAQAYKIATIDALLQRYPERHFILVGDSGEKDPEVYGEIARRYPSQISAILIRNVTGEARDSVRFMEAFTKVPPQHWQVFNDADEIEDRNPIPTVSVP